MASRQEIETVKAEIEQKLIARPGVTGVGIGYKIVGGQKTDILAIRVYVEKKKEKPPEEAIPKLIRDIPTDVIERRFQLQRDDVGESD